MKHPIKNLFQNKTFLKDKVFWISIAMLVVIAITFWSQSRMPALNEKAQIGDRINISAIAFDVIYPVVESQPLYERVYKATINWGYTNWKGMTFGFLLAAAFITLLQVLPKTPASNNRFLNSLYGLGIGSPLGVCVNCATPIAQGLIHAGARLETSLSMLLSSPTLNPIVLTIALSLLSFHIVFIKVIVSVFFIIFMVPFLIKLSGCSDKPLSSSEKINQKIGRYNPSDNHLQYAINSTPRPWIEAIYFSFQSFFKNFIYIIKLTLPLMVLAGLLGSLLIEILPIGSLSKISINPITLSAAAAIGVFLPVPIAFDVLIVSILISSGLDIGLASTLLFSLGIFSIYPALVIGKSVSIKLSCLFFVSVMIVAMAVGVITNAVDENINQKISDSIEKEFSTRTIDVSLKGAINACRPLEKSGAEKKCLNKILLSNAFINAGEKICHLDSPNSKEKNDYAIKMCHQVFSLIIVKKESIEKNNINLCKKIPSDLLVDQCMINFIHSHAMEYTSLSVCQQIKNLSRQKYCKVMLISGRMPLKQEKVCELNLSDNTKTQCLDNLRAHIASEFGELSRCDTLSSDNSKKICRKTVTSLKITNLQNYSICQKLVSKEEINICKNSVIKQKAMQEKNLSICDYLPNNYQYIDCQIDVIVRKKQIEVENKKLLAFDGFANDFVSGNEESFNKNIKDQKPIANKLLYKEIYSDKNISLFSIKSFDRKIEKGKIFRKMLDEMSGLKSVWNFNLTDFMEPFIYGKGVASGDFNNDGWPDLVFASNNGVHLYKNKGDGSFVYNKNIKIDNHPLNAFVIAFVDIDNDGWQDLFLTAYGDEKYFFKNTKGRFSNKDFLKIPKNNNIIALSVGFADWDKDGDLDFVLGNWSYGAEGAFIPEKSNNIWYTNNYPEFKAYFPDEAPGETLTIVMSDINNDGNEDLIIGNDRKYPDMFYLGKAGGGFSKVNADQKLILETSLNTMSYDSADFNNDLLLDIFSTDMFVASGINRDYCDYLSVPSDKKRCQWLLKGGKAVESFDVDWCKSLENISRAECYAAMAIKLAKRNKDNALCKKVPGIFFSKQKLCENISRKINEIDLSSYKNNIEQKESNKILINTKSNKFIDATEAMGIKNSYWGWTGKAADLDNDGWQDIYIGNGLGFGQHNKDIHSNIFYHNQKGVNFVQAEEKFGLTNYINTPAYTYVDFDLDGDIDIISSGVMSTPSIYVNQGTTSNSVSFVLRDHLGNKFCIGCKVIITYDNGNKNQIRELKLSGGFMSFDDPVAYFGIGGYEFITQVKITWTTGKEWVLDKKLMANHRYKIIRFDDKAKPKI